MTDKIFVIDRSDNRNIYLKKMLENDGFMVFDFDENIFYPAGSIVYIFAPSKTVGLETAKKIRNSSTVFLFRVTGAASDDFLMRDVTLVNMMDDEMYATENAMLTAEGALSLIISHTDRQLKNLNFLVAGLGRVGKSVTSLLGKLSLDVTAIATTDIEKCMSVFFTDGKFITEDELAEDIGKFSVVINTVPKKLFTSAVLTNLKPTVFLLDLASKPGGFDTEYCTENGINYLSALGVPAEFSPYDAAYCLKMRILKALKIA